MAPDPAALSGTSMTWLTLPVPGSRPGFSLTLCDHQYETPASALLTLLIRALPGTA
jgi:hypothetical protein